jgi:hypothetical protein
VTRSIPDFTPMWWMRTSVVPVHIPPTRPWFAAELLGDLGVMVAGPACSRVRHDLLQYVSLAVVFVVAPQPAHGLIAFAATLGRSLSWLEAQVKLQPMRSR